MKRLQEVDALRAFALIGIALANYPILAQSAQDLLAPVGETGDQIVVAALEMFVSGKFFVLFSFLFGWGMGVQIASAQRKATSARGPFLRRLAALAALGVAHALLVFHGDILVLYAALGLILWMLRNATPRRLVQIALFSVGLSLLTYALLGYGLAEETAALPAVPEGAGYLGGFVEAAVQRARDWPSSLAFILLFNGPLALAAFCSGLAAYKSNLLDPGSAHWAMLRRAMPWLIGLGLATNVAHTIGFGAILEGAEGSLVTILLFAALGLGAPSLGLVYLFVVVEAARKWGGPRWMSAAGSMSATIYVGQGIVGGMIFNGYGAGLYGTLSAPLIALASLGATALLFAAATVWSRMFGRGPLEQLLRAVTHWGTDRST